MKNTKTDLQIGEKALVLNDMPPVFLRGQLVQIINAFKDKEEHQKYVIAAVDASRSGIKEATLCVEVAAESIIGID
jgi:hypothetical protein